VVSLTFYLYLIIIYLRCWCRATGGDLQAAVVEAELAVEADLLEDDKEAGEEVGLSARSEKDNGELMNI